ncbi:type II toxin-antitoxin system RelE/ParE family toxin [Sorangium sp. So ce764]|uniref:type II toxin-antitoxin system RelE/ParE family toxin n=1 Tax=Sorangium sp. So ce764 TaxID=3133320 RepID=UPI003F5F44F7
MIRIIRSPLAQRDIIKVIKYTRERWGTVQARQYRRLISDALVAIARDPRRGRPYSGVKPGVLGYPIGQPGKPARHVLFYRCTDAGHVAIIRFLHEGMDLRQHLP